MARGRDLSKLEMGFISPTGEWLFVPFCEHETKALEILQSYKYDLHNVFGNATDHLIEKFGYILIDGCHDVDIQVPTIVTDAQKITLEQWLSRNIKFIKWFSIESINNLRNCLDWLDEGVEEKL